MKSYDVHNLVGIAQSIAPVNTATAAVNGATVDLRNYKNMGRVTAVACVGTMTEGTLTFSVEDSANGSDWAAMTPISGANKAYTTSNDAATDAFADYRPDPARPYIRIVTVETVSVTTAVPFSAHFLLTPATL